MQEGFFPLRPEAKPKIYAYEDSNPQYKGMLKVGFTTGSVEKRVAEQYPTKRPGAEPPWRIVFAEPAMRSDGSHFRDHAVHRMLKKSGSWHEEGEWFSCTVDQLRAAYIAECRQRMFEIFDREYTENCPKEANDETREAVRHILRHNILCGDALTMKTATGEPIIFAEWSAINAHLIKRRDFRLDQMLEESNNHVQMDLFGDSGAYHRDEAGAIILKPVREFPPVHYRKLQQHE